MNPHSSRAWRTTRFSPLSHWERGQGVRVFASHTVLFHPESTVWDAILTRTMLCLRVA